MTLKSLALIGATLLLSAPGFAATYFGGFEDTVKHGDYDYNDIVFSLSGTGLTLHTTDGAWYAQPSLATSGTPFWNNASGDGSKYNVGYCIYGGGNCNRGVALDPGASYLAKTGNRSASANDVSFTTSGPVSADVELEISADTDVLGWYSLSNPGDIHWLNGFGQTGLFHFTPQGSFGIAANNGIFALGDTFYSSQVVKAATSQFAFFGSPVPEPGAMSLVGGGLLAAGLFFRKRQTKA
jgi:hypothetical protein